MLNATPKPMESMEPTYRGVLVGHWGISLAFSRWEIPNPKGRVVISHGYGEHGERYKHIAQWLNGLGWSVSAMDHYGFGRSEGRRGDARGIRPFVDDQAFFLRNERLYDAERTQVKPRIVNNIPLPPLPVCPQVLLGHSFGGLVALLTLLWHSNTMEGLVLTSPVLKLREMSLALRVLQRLLLWVAPHYSLDLPNDKDQVCSNPDMVKAYWNDPLCHRFISAAFAKAMEEGRRDIWTLGKELDRPILLLDSDNDTVVDPDGSDDLWASLRPGLLERRRMEGFKHEILHDLRRTEAQAIIEPWLEQRLAEWSRNRMAFDTTSTHNAPVQGSPLDHTHQPDNSQRCEAPASPLAPGTEHSSDVH